jgi:hypothetical protein
MADSTFWRSIADQFRALPIGFKMLRADRTSIVGSDRIGQWNLVGMTSHSVQFEAIARHAAFELPNPVCFDLLTAWLEALIKQGLASFNSEVISASKNPDEMQVTGSLYNLPELSANYCQMLESAALQNEFDEKQRNNPKNWSQFHQQYEAFKSMKEIINEPAERISEEWVRNAIARIHGIKPEDVTREQIAFEVAGLLSSTKRHIEMIPSAPQESPPASEGKPEVQTDAVQPSSVALVGPKTLTTDGLNHYRAGVPETFGLDVDFAQLVKLFGDFGQGPDARYSPARITEVISKVRSGDPDPDHISTSFVERQNLTMRMAIRRFTRLTNAFSKKLLNLKAAVALHFAYYNFCRVHSSLRVTPAMEVGLTDHVWTIGELLTA